MDIVELQSAIHQMVSDAVTYMEAELSPQRALATNYYQGTPFGKGEEKAGRSQFVVTTLRDTVIAMMPSFMRMFTGPEHVVEYVARPKTENVIGQKVAEAKQATEFVNEVVFAQDNPGVLILHACFKDALVHKTGILKWWWDDASAYKTYTAQNLDVQTLEGLAQDPDIEITRKTEVQNPDLGIPLWNISYKHWRREGFARFTTLPPEEFLISRDARSLEDAQFVGHRTRKTRSELLGMGIAEADIDAHGGISGTLRYSIEEIARRKGIIQDIAPPDESSDRSDYTECYAYLDLDGDGIGELNLIRTLGPQNTVVGEPEPVAIRPFALFCPDPEPHVVFGQGIDDRTMDLQLTGSRLLRAIFDSAAKSIFPDIAHQEGEVDLASLRSTAVGKDITTYGDPNVVLREFPHTFKGGEMVPLLDVMNQIKQQRVGPLPGALDPDALQSSTDKAVNAVVNAANEQLELIARMFAEGLKTLFRGLLQLVVEHQPRQRIVRLRNQYVPIDPRAWDADMDVSVHVAVGSQQQQRVQTLMGVAQDQQMILQTMGLANPFVTPAQARNTRAKILELNGFPDASEFYQPIPADWQPPPPPETPNPDLILAQAEMVKAQAKLQSDQANFQVAQVSAQQEMLQLRADLASKERELQLKREEMHLVDERERDKAEADVATKIAIANAQFNANISIEQIRADVAQQKMASDAASARETATIQADTAKKVKKMSVKSGDRVSEVTVGGE